MSDNEKEEAANLKEEFEWVLREEVHSILHQLHSVLVGCAHRFPVPLYGNEGQKQDKFILTSQPEQLKCIVTLTGDSITHASHKLIFVAYQLSSVHGTMRIDSCQADCAVPWLSDVLFMLTAALHMCQQLKDKLCVFSQYKDFTVGSRSASMVLN
ncbi:hypothetical protein MSG28_003541 [Choristoneura fumiferana]|uniref:Uncharacterized protein n=1 Tax=Choristoneura fumiferana TaxID=7141 RepID=A0ACC0KFA7_CHOFU|nr:hypothetical protein MSG28_003541 [Choristoneura fumiferana]